MREPEKRQTTMKLASPSIAESRPKPTSAIEPATMPAATATVPSMQSQPRLVQASSFASRASGSHSADRTTSCMSRLTWIVLTGKECQRVVETRAFPAEP
jgi:hypothetical protein